MPAYRGRFSEEEISELVAFVRSLRAAEGSTVP
jgi:hypothetical protein